MSRLNASAREQIRQTGLTIAGYIRHTMPDGMWGGDACGCTDDRCIGHHHDTSDECRCLPLLLDEYVASSGGAR